MSNESSVYRYPYRLLSNPMQLWQQFLTTATFGYFTDIHLFCCKHPQYSPSTHYTHIAHPKLRIPSCTVPSSITVILLSNWVVQTFVPVSCSSDKCAVAWTYIFTYITVIYIYIFIIYICIIYDIILSYKCLLYSNKSMHIPNALNELYIYLWTIKGRLTYLYIYTRVNPVIYFVYNSTFCAHLIKEVK